MQDFEGDSHAPNFADAQYKIDTSLLKVPATAERTNSQLDKDIRGHPEISPAGEITWQGEQQIDEETRNENPQRCANCHLLESEYGRVLFERDLAQRNLRLASYRPGDDLQRHRNKESNGAAATFPDDKMEHSHDEPDQFSSRMSWRYSELPSAKVLPRLKDDLRSPTSARKDRGASNTNTEGTRTFLNGHANYLSDSEDSIRSSLDDDGDGDDNHVDDRVHESDENENDDNVDNDGDNQEIERTDDDKCNNGDDSLDVDNDDEDDDDDSDGHDDSDDNNDDYDDDDDDDDDEKDGDIGQDASYSCPDGNTSVVSDRVNESLTQDDEDDDDDDDDDDEKDGDIGQDASYLCPDGNTSLVSDRVNKSLTQESSFSFHVSSSNVENFNSNENIDCWPGSSSNNNISGEKVYEKSEDSSTSSEGDDNAAGGTSPYAHKKKSPIVSVASNVTSQGARPRTSSQTPVHSNEGHLDLHDGKIPSLDVVGISQGFLARHSMDQSFPYSSNTEDNDLPISESTSCTDWPQTFITSNDNSSASWGLPRPPFPDRSEPLQDRAYPMGVNPRYGDPRNVGYQPLAPMTGLETGWQLSNQQQPQSGRTSSNFPPGDQRISNRSNRAESLLTSHDESPSHSDVLGRFLGATGTQGDNSFNRQAWMPGSYETARRWPRYDYNRHQTNPSSIGDLALRNEPAVNSPAVSPPAPPITLPSVSLPNASLNLQTAASDPLTSQSSPSTMSGGHNIHLSQATTSTEDNSLVALERKVAEACAVVERVLKEREERIKRQKEEVQRQREIREQRQREARERREREERDIRERAEREREDMAVAERAPIQESPLWQCEHYQRRCSVRFPCCGVFYPCHRCHNGSGACEADDKKANQASHVKCASCGNEEEINEGSQTCSNCGARLSEYFCFRCKHFTGVDKNPFHCDKCGICRIYRDRSFHCDVCNVCLDKRLEGKHKCRPNSGHDECCICLEDAFSGCQILPCSHKVHRECAIAMIQNGVRNCPICRHPLYGQGSQ